VYGDYSFANALVLFGALQGLLLILFLFKKRKGNPLAYVFFTVFLFSLVYVNLWYGLYFMEIYQIGNFSLILIPYPYEYLIGTGFYFYIKSQWKVPKPAYQREFYLFIPALAQWLLELYWSILSIQQGDNNIYRELESSGFFAVNEILRFIFYGVLGFLTIQFLAKAQKPHKPSTREKSNRQWLGLLTRVFIAYVLLSLLLTCIVFLIAPTHVITLYSFYLTFFTNTLLIYWIGFMGFRKPNILFVTYTLEKKAKGEKYHQIEEKLVQLMEAEEQFKSPDFSLSKLALLSGVASKELSDHIHTHHKCNVSTYINTYRVEKVKTLLDSQAFGHYTLEAIAQEAGFKSKSSFHAIFKQYTSLTPAQYRKREK